VEYLVDNILFIRVSGKVYISR